MEKTAVEWLVIQLKKDLNPFEKKNIIEEAEKMEKKQIIDACIWFDDTGRSFSEIEKGAIDYYKEKYK